MSWTSPYFTKDEMKCSHTGIEMMDPDFMQQLTLLREAWGKPMVITSAYRHPTHPIEARKDKPGAHTTGRAVDIAVQGEDALNLLELILIHDFTGVGIQQKGSGRFIHIDNLQHQEGWPRPTIWSY
jgi:zinc D-Ala-D-Ala carboxypeptidase